MFGCKHFHHNWKKTQDEQLSCIFLQQEGNKELCHQLPPNNPGSLLARHVGPLGSCAEHANPNASSWAPASTPLWFHSWPYQHVPGASPYLHARKHVVIAHK